KRKNALYQMRQILLLNICLMGGFALVGCDIHIDDSIDRPTPLTEIVRVEVLPNPVVVGDSLTLHCVTIDSHVTGYTYSWRTTEGYQNTIEPYYRIKAPNEVGTYSFSVRVRKDIPNVSFPFKEFQVVVVTK